MEIFKKNTLPMIRQSEATECGLACIAMILEYHGNNMGLKALRKNFGASLRGMTLEGLSKVATRCDMLPRPLQLELHELKELKTPCILHWSMIHFVVLKAVHDEFIVVHDPALGVQRIPMDEVSARFTGVALELAPLAGFQRHIEKPKSRLREQLLSISGVKRAIFQLFLISLAAEVLVIMVPLYQQWVIDGVLSTGDQDLLKMLAVGFAAIALLNTCIGLIRGWMANHFSHETHTQWVIGVFSHLLKLPVSFFEKRYLGDVLSKFGSSNNIAQSLTATTFVGLVDGLLALTTLILMFYYSVELAAISLIGLSLQMLTKWLLHGPLMLAADSEIDGAAREQSHFIETVRGIRTIKLYNKEQERRAHWLDLVYRSAQARHGSERLRVADSSAKGALSTLENVVVIYTGAHMILNGGFTVGLLFSFILYKQQFAARAMNLVELFMRLSVVKMHAERASDIIDADVETDFLEHCDVPQVAPTIELRNVFFRYSMAGPWVLNNLSLRVDAGESVAITGASGSGKSTLMKLILGLDVPQSGEILVGGININALGVRSVRALCASVMQDDVLFAGTIHENIAFFAPNTQSTAVESAARLASIHHEIIAMPMGYNTYIGDMGSSLSGGQKQRLLLARALFREPKILLLDEATSHLDGLNEAAVSKSIKNLGVTRFFIAHRQETIMSADRVVVLTDGAINGSAAMPRGAQLAMPSALPTVGLSKTDSVDEQSARAPSSPDPAVEAGG